jgi:predicted Rossmann fold nucleotide-binding protein DprA/Smf involved in DNA uptake
MSQFTDNTYWIAIAHLPRWGTERINRLIIDVVHEKQMTWDAFFTLNKDEWQKILPFTDKELTDLENVKTDIPRLAFIAEQLQNEGFEVIPINDTAYPTLLKENLKIRSCPPVIYIKGRKSLLQDKAVAIVGSRKAGKAALEFTDAVAKKCVADQKLIVSGFAKGVDLQALDSTLAANGKSIIVLPQGILTFQSGFKKYYQPIVSGNVLVISTFFPKAAWEVGLAMARNVYIYGLAEEIYVAESDNKGGTWEGAMNGIKRQRKIYVRIPEQLEKNANLELIRLGAVPVDAYGAVMDINSATTIQAASLVAESTEPYHTINRDIEKEILGLLKTGSFTVKEITETVKPDWDNRKLSGFLKKNPNIKTVSGKPVRYTIQDVIATSLF